MRIPAFHCTGQVLIHAETSKQQRRLCVALLLPQTNNDEAIRFYSRFGFEVGETVSGYYKRLDPPDAVVLRKRLQPSSNGEDSSEASANGTAS